MKKYRVAHLGCGHRGEVHLDSWLSDPERLSLEAVCDLDIEKSRRLVGARNLAVKIYTDADRMLAEVKPDIFCFCTLPHVRLSMVELAVKHGVRALVFEKPMATSLAEAAQITALCRKHKIRAVVSHQQKYLTSFQKLKSVLDAGGVGEVQRIDAECQPSLSQLGTHYIDYVLWANGGRKAQWVVGHVHGKEQLADSHPSPNYTLGQIGFANGVRSIVQFGKLSPPHMSKAMFWGDNRLTVYGSQGHAWCDTDGRWGGFNSATNGKMVMVEGENWEAQQRYRLQKLFVQDLANWLDDEARVHPCNVDVAYHGYEILEAICLSALEHRRVSLPLDSGQHEDIFERMRRSLPECPELESA